jgi:dihydrofolate reductase
VNAQIPARTIPIVLIAAVGDNGVIGRGNALPWRLKSDLAHFRALTMGKPVVMGRRTFQSIGRPLKGRTNIVVSRDPAFAAPGILIASALAAALQSAHADALRRGADSIAVIGGGDIYAQAMPMADRLEITHVHASPEGDAVFPPIDIRLWRETARREHPAGPDDSSGFAVATYERAPGAAATK